MIQPPPLPMFVPRCPECIGNRVNFTEAIRCCGCRRTLDDLAPPYEVQMRLIRCDQGHIHVLCLRCMDLPWLHVQVVVTLGHPSARCPHTLTEAERALVALGRIG